MKSNIFFQQIKLASQSGEYQNSNRVTLHLQYCKLSKLHNPLTPSNRPSKNKDPLVFLQNRLNMVFKTLTLQTNSTGIIKPLRGNSWLRTKIITIRMPLGTLRLTSFARRIHNRKWICRYQFSQYPPRGLRFHSIISRCMRRAAIKCFSKIGIGRSPY